MINGFNHHYNHKHITLYQFYNHIHVFSPSHGASGGILAIRDSTCISHKRVFVSTWLIVIEAVWVC